MIISYKGISSFYFKYVIKKIIEIGNLKDKSIKILDYGCGNKYLQKVLKRKIYNLDIDPRYNEVHVSYTKLKFNAIVINHVLMYLPLKEIKDLFKKVYLVNKNCSILVGMSKETCINKTLKFIAMQPKAHSDIVTHYEQQVNFIKKNFFIVKKINCLFLTEVYLLRFKNAIK